MNTLLLLHGPNLNLLGQRDAGWYGVQTLQELESAVRERARERGFELIALQSNHEGVLIDAIQEHAPAIKGLIINPGALTHYSYALHDAIVDAQIPTIEVHLSDIHAREPWRAHSVIAPACKGTILGKKLQGYLEAVDSLTGEGDHGA
jgi:3-dehydroquinate dehydratase-2